VEDGQTRAAREEEGRKDGGDDEPERRERRRLREKGASRDSDGEATRGRKSWGVMRWHRDSESRRGETREDRTEAL
jgi:hypothetical protein